MALVKYESIILVFTSYKMTIYTAFLQTRDGRIVEEEFSGYRNGDDPLDDISNYFSMMYPGVDSCVVRLPSGEEVILGLKRSTCETEEE